MQKYQNDRAVYTPDIETQKKISFRFHFAAVNVKSEEDMETEREVKIITVQIGIVQMKLQRVLLWV